MMASLKQGVTVVSVEGPPMTWRLQVAGAVADTMLSRVWVTGTLRLQVTETVAGTSLSRVWVAVAVASVVTGVPSIRERVVTMTLAWAVSWAFVGVQQ